MVRRRLDRMGRKSADAYRNLIPLQLMILFNTVAAIKPLRDPSRKSNNPTILIASKMKETHMKWKTEDNG